MLSSDRMQWLVNLYYCSLISPRFFRLYFKRSKLITSEVRELLDREDVDLDHVPSPLYERIPLYLFSNALTAQWFSTMRGHPLTGEEKTNCQLMAIATPLFDYLSDGLKASHADIKVFIDDPGSDPLLQICSKLHRLSCERSFHPELFETYFAKTMEFQEKSLKQKTNGITEEFTRQITKEKGGYALLLYRCALGHKILDGEDQLIFKLGGLMQLYNDLFDIYRDHTDGISTLATRCTSVKSLKTYYQSCIADIYESLFSLSYLTRNLKMTKMLISITLNTGFVCLEQLQNLENQAGQFDVALHPREALICDMEKPLNIFSTITRTIRNG